MQFADQPDSAALRTLPLGSARGPLSMTLMTSAADARVASTTIQHRNRCVPDGGRRCRERLPSPAPGALGTWLEPRLCLDPQLANTLALLDDLRDVLPNVGAQSGYDLVGRSAEMLGGVPGR